MKATSTKSATRSTHTVDPKRSRAAKKAAVTRAHNKAVATTKSLRLHHKLIAGGLIVSVIVLTFFGIKSQLEVYAATYPSTTTSNGTCGGTFTMRSTKPQACNSGTGILDVKPTKVYSGSLTIKTDNTVIKNVIINGPLVIKAKNVVIQNCDIRIGTTDRVFAVNTSNATNAIVQYNEIHSTVKSRLINGIGTRNVTAYRNNIHDVVDGLDINSSGMTNGDGALNVSIKGNYIHDLLYYSPDPAHDSNGTHLDGIQLSGGSGVTIVGNYFAGTASSKLSYVGSGGVANPHPGLSMSDLMFTPVTGKISSVSVEDNWMSGSYMAMNAENSAAIMTSTHFWKNKFDRTMVKYANTYGAFNLRWPNPGVDTGTGTNKNYFVDTGEQITIIKVSS